MLMVLMMKVMEREFQIWLIQGSEEKIQLTKYWSNNNTITPCHLINCIFPLGLKVGLQYYKAINDN